MTDAARNRSLTRIASGQLICRTCLREIRPPRKYLATESALWYLRKRGFNVPDDLSREESNRLLLLNAARLLDGHDLPDDTPLAELERIEADDREQREASRPPVRHFYTKVVGVTFQNDDGSDRQAIIARCSPFETLVAEHEDNPHDPNAMRVCTQGGDQIGHLSREVAADLRRKMQRDFNCAVIATQITGGTARRPTLGVNVLVLVAKPGVSQDEIQEYFDSIAPQVLADCRAERSDDEDFP